jgi:hypothetical protein
MTTSNTEKQGGRQAAEHPEDAPPEKIAQAAPGQGRIFHGRVRVRSTYFTIGVKCPG